PVTLFREDRDRRILTPFLVFAAEIIFKRAGAGGKQSQLVPASIARIRTQHGRIGCGNDGKLNVLGDVMSDAIVAIDPGSAHWASSRLLLPKHEMVDHQRPIGPRE